ncbi:hypothetical protein B0H13DRAFT_1888661 [Mycena leptocephala]|nr:hypothetical protein B0H13DRAFT_1888661 [Mycena leptocephala]
MTRDRKGKERSCRSASEDPGCTSREAEVLERDYTRSRSGGAAEGGVEWQRWRWRYPPAAGRGVRVVFLAWAALGVGLEGTRAKEQESERCAGDGRWQIGDRNPSRTRRSRPRTRQARKGVALTTRRRRRHGVEARRGTDLEARADMDGYAPEDQDPPALPTHAPTRASFRLPDDELALEGEQGYRLEVWSVDIAVDPAVQAGQCVLEKDD